MEYLSASEIAQQVREGKLTSVDITSLYLERIKEHNEKLQAYVFHQPEQALAGAKHCDQSGETEEKGLLHGVPVSIKECYLWEGTPTTLNYPPKRNYRAKETSILVKRLLEQGAVILGKTNVPTLLSDSQTFGPLYPTANNPFDLTRTPGGSTGGGAAAVAAGLTTFELGSDIGGSIRNPSHYCGLFGFKPTQNGYASDGHVPPYPEDNIGISIMNHTGPLARTMNDIQLANDVLYKPDLQRLHYLDTKGRNVNLQGMKVAYFDSLYGLQAGSDVRNAIHRMVNTIEKLGGEAVPIHIDKFLSERMLKTWTKLLGVMMGQGLPWLVRKMFYLKFSPSLKASSLPARKELKQGLSLSFQHFSQAMAEREELIQEVNRLFEPYDFVLSPTSMGPAFEHNHKHRSILLDGEAIPYLDYCFPFVAFYNLTGHPVLTVPTGLNKQGLPIGLSISAPHHQDQELIHFGKTLESNGYTFTAPKL
ncbi:MULTISPECIES: amidase [Gammaproteobacteria]|uniref:amidase n=1 Tax=Gammaproteobacteria TaxID=1236 RepID=UPI000DCF79A7|nr:MULTISPECIES: amidase family protein [Gammaproteobacteria]RTE86566.1 hypothetical protein DQX04_08405 [Aliidiomarina sp. B3213]TCZ90879.1 hypothetical protein EYQ95_08640 [Lysobacter sp. N42]